MSSITLALAHDYLRRCIWPGACTLGYLIGLPWLGYQLVAWKHMQFPPEMVQAPLPMGVIIVVLFGALTITWSAQGENRFGVGSRLYVLPIRTWLIVACRLLQCGATAAVLYLIVVAMNNYSLGTTWPMLGPALILAIAAAWIPACVWSLHHFRLWRLIGLTALLVAFGSWIGWRFYPQGFYSPRQNWAGPNWHEAMELLAWALAAFTVGWEGVARHRRGDHEGLPAWLTRLRIFWDTQVLDRRQPFSSPEDALMWQEWMRRGLVMPLIIGGLLLIFSAIGAVNVSMGWARPIDVLEVQLGTVLVGVPQLALVIGLCLGHRGGNSAQFEFDSFSATRPVTDALLAAAFLRTVLRCVASSFAVAAAICLATLGWVCWQEGFAALDSITRKIPLLDSPLGGWAIPLVASAAILATWTTTGMGAALVLCGHKPLVGKSLGALVTLLLGWIILVQVFLPVSVGEVVSAVGAAILGLALIATTVWMFQRAARARLIAMRSPWVSLISWVALCGLAAIAMSMKASPFGMPPSMLRWLWLPMLPGVMALVFMPLALVPLAIAWNRHH